MKRIVAVVWDSYYNMLLRASKNLKGILEISVYSARVLEKESERFEKAIKELSNADLIFFYRSSEAIWERIEKFLKEGRIRGKIVFLGNDPSCWTFSNVKKDILSKAYSYLVINGEENLTNMLKLLAKEELGIPIEYDPPKEILWEGLYHPKAEKVFSNIDEFLSWYEGYWKERKSKGTVGILFSRHYWINGNLEVEDELIEQLEKSGFKVIPAFTYSLKDESLGTKGSGEVVLKYFLDSEGRPRIDAMIKLVPFFLASGKDVYDTDKSLDGVEILKKLDVPCFSPISSYYKTVEEWENGELNLDIGWAVAMPEFEGVIEPIIIAAQKEEEEDTRKRVPIPDRVKKLVDRIEKWILLKKTPPSERRIAFILHNNPCASVEATVGAGAHLDTLQSVVEIMKRMKEEGYNVDPPESGKELIDEIMSKKAISEFRWTTVEEIVSKGGALRLLEKEKYMEWFNELPEKTRNRIIEAWGNPPGEWKEGIPPAMVYDGKIVITGVRYGNVVVLVQPKRGCAGARCDGQVCKILHDPDVPPPHQYIATYKWLSREFGAHAIVHVGTHGNLEFLPGKGVGLSSSCFPDICIDTVPHLYIYNSDNPPEGTIAKRRSYAVLVDHMQTVMTKSGLYEELLELDRLLTEYEEVKKKDKARAHALKHLILEELEKCKLDAEIQIRIGGKKRSLKEISQEELSSLPFEELIKEIHGRLSTIRNTQIQDGMHVFGFPPKGERRIDFIYSILHYESEERISLRKKIAELMGYDLSELLRNSNRVDEKNGRSYGAILEEIDSSCKDVIRDVLQEKDIPWDDPDSVAIKERIIDINRRIEESKEIESLLHGFSGGYIPAGPSGLITRGRDDILPTGRNFYSLDPYRVPTKASWKIGKKLADALIEKFMKEEGRYPENIAMYWMCTDIMWSDGEGMAQILYLLGVRPIWHPNGRIKGIEIIPLEELKRPRIDVTIRVSGITRDNFPNVIELVDEAIQKVASLDEPPERNFVRKHVLEQIKNGTSLRDATLRIFCSMPGTYQAGTQLAVYASAWKEEKDLAEVFLYWNGYAYGKGIWGKEKHKEFGNILKSVDVTYNKVVSDEYDLFGCCCYFGTHGGMTAAARYLSKRNVKAYYGDTREGEYVEVRDLADEIRRVVRTKLLNPKWIEGMKRHGYKGAGDISNRIGRVYGWEATTQEVDDWIFDEIARKFLMDKENRKFFEENNPWALEEIGRRLIEAWERGLWNPSDDVKKALKDIYLEIEGWIEDRIGDVQGEFQGGSIDVVTKDEVEFWRRKMQEVLGT